jgi:hypothetical protein
MNQNHSCYRYTIGQWTATILRRFSFSSSGFNGVDVQATRKPEMTPGRWAPDVIDAICVHTVTMNVHGIEVYTLAEI